MNQATQRRIAVVTGGAVGIGAAICERLAREGAMVIVADIDDVRAARTADRLCEGGGAAAALHLDVGSPDSIQAAFGRLDQDHGRCDILVNNAGVARTFPFLDYPLEHWTATMNVNVTGAMLCSQSAGRLMRRHGWGRIITIASVAGMRAVGTGRAAYGTSKAAVIGLTRQMAAELAELGITANAVAPGPVDTPMTQELHAPAFRAQYTAAIPAGRYGRTEEIATVVAFLASEGAAYVNGITMAVDGGFMASGARPARGEAR